MSTLSAFVISMMIEFPVISLMKIWQNREEKVKAQPTGDDGAPLVGQAEA